MTGSAGSDDAPRYKVGKIIEQYSLAGVGDELESRWIDEPDAASLRELTAYFNKEVLRSALTDSGHQQVGGDIDHLYAVLTGDDVSPGERTRIRKLLEREGVDVEQLETDFVSHQAIHTYLTKGRGVEKSTESKDQVKRGEQTINRLRSRLVAVSETTLSTLRDTGRISLGSFDVFVEINVRCTDCQTYKGIFELLSDRGCECDESE